MRSRIYLENNAEFRRYYGYFKDRNPLNRKEEVRLLRIIKGAPSKFEEQMGALWEEANLVDRLWDDEDEQSFDAFLDSVLGDPHEYGHGGNGNGNGKKLTPEQEEARNTFVMHNMRLVLSRVLRFRNQNDSDAMELVSYGTDGLLRAIQLFDLSKGVRFSTYAVHWIDSFIRKGIEFVDGTQVPRLRYLNREFKKTERSLKKKTGRRPTQEEVAVQLQWGARTVQEHQTGAYASTSLEIMDAEETRTLPAHTCAEKEEMAEALHSAMNIGILSVHEEDIIRRHYGLGHDEETLQRLAVAYQVTKERIRQIENGGLHKLYLELRRFRQVD